MNKYEELTELVLEWNEKINVTAIKDPEDFMMKNVRDSLMITELSEYAAAGSVMDMGTGGGFPGLPMAIASPEKSFTLVDSVGKKLKVIDDVCAKLGLSNVRTLHSRAEDLSKKDLYDLVTSRAVANLSTLSEYCLPFVKLGGFFIAFKTEDSLAELDAASHAIEVLGGELSSVVRYSQLGDSSEENSGHLFIIIKKVKDTPAAYPRKAGDPGKKPL